MSTPTDRMAGTSLSRSLQRRLDDWREQSDTPGVAAVARLNGEVLWAGASGLADRERNLRLEADAPFLIYSITKTFTSVCVLQLDQEGRLELDEPAGRWLPDLSLPADVTLRHLLRHTAGLRDYGGLPEYRADVRSRPSSPWSAREFLDATLPQGLLFEPGKGWSYSNIGYMLLRHIIEHASGKSFRQCVEERIAGPLGLPQTRVAESLEDLHDLVAGYGCEVSEDGEERDVRGVYHPGWCAPGVIASTAAELTRFYDRLFAGELVDPSHLAMMREVVRVPGHFPPVVSPSSGLGILADPDGPFGSSYGHGGQGPGYSLAATVLPGFPGGRLCIATFCNKSREPVADDAERVLLECLCERSS